MNGSIYLTFSAAAVGLNPLDYPSMDETSMGTGESLKAFSKAVQKSPIIGDLDCANNLDGTNYVKREGKNRLRSHHALLIDPRTKRFNIEQKYKGVELEVVVVNCWFTVQVNQEFVPGIWGSSDKLRGVEVTRDPSKHDANRMFIRIITPDLRSARLLLHRTLQGKLCLTPWIS